jgi:hypothetical protein
LARQSFAKPECDRVTNCNVTALYIDIVYNHNCSFLHITIIVPLFWVPVISQDMSIVVPTSVHAASETSEVWSFELQETGTGLGAEKSSTENGDIAGYTLWLFNIAMENGPFIDGLPIKNGDFPWLC